MQIFLSGGADMAVGIHVTLPEIYAPHLGQGWLIVVIPVSG
jgi:hypothetical protein